MKRFLIVAAAALATAVPGVAMAQDGHGYGSYSQGQTYRGNSGYGGYQYRGGDGYNDPYRGADYRNYDQRDYRYNDRRAREEWRERRHERRERFDRRGGYGYYGYKTSRPR